MSIGSFVLMLHSHLPFYRKAGMWPFGEESFYECMTETYIPLLNLISQLWSEGIPAKLTLSISPILAEQMADPYLQEGMLTFLKNRILAARKDEKRFSPSGQEAHTDFWHLAKYYSDWFQKILSSYEDTWNRNILAGFRKFQDLDAIEITTCAATHGFLPLLASDASLGCQLKTGVDTYRKHFGKAAKGIWLPECAYRPASADRAGLEKWLYKYGLEYFFTDWQAIQGGQAAEARRVFGAYGNVAVIPIVTRAKTGLSTFEAFWLKEYPVAVMGRHEQAGYQVWSADHGYPGDGNYREFHKKDDVSGLHYWRLTSKTTDLGQKQLYNPEVALERLKENSDHYVGLIQQALTSYLKTTNTPGLVMVSFDTELFGHWWFEGINWIKEVIKKLRTYTNVTIHTASEYLKAHPPVKAIELPESSWGAGGHWQVWCNKETEWMWSIIWEAEKIMDHAVNTFKTKNKHSERVLKQAARELLLLESSDWPFLITTGQAKEYATERFNQHHERFRELIKMVSQGTVDESRLKEIEEIDNCFPTLDLEPFLAARQEKQANDQELVKH